MAMSENSPIPDGGAAPVLEAGDVRVELRPADGGRIRSLTVGGRELLVIDGTDDPIRWGTYPMAPWAGRVRHGRFTFEGREHRLPLGLPPHAIHGVVYDRPWTVLAASARSAVLAIELADPWPFRGRVEQRIELAPGWLEVAMTLRAEDRMPATMGWHPWFRRDLGDDGPPVRLEFEAAEMLVRDEEGIPTGERIAPPPGPWDDAFTGVGSPPTLEWPGRLRLELRSSCAWWVVYTLPEHALCVEPQSGPPDALNDRPEVIPAGGTMRHTMRWSWARLDASGG
jgi:aldose 1-epimerase